MVKWDQIFGAYLWMITSNGVLDPILGEMIDLIHFISWSNVDHPKDATNWIYVPNQSQLYNTIPARVKRSSVQIRILYESIFYQTIRISHAHKYG